jgi:hypothetical protein
VQTASGTPILAAVEAAAPSVEVSAPSIPTLPPVVPTVNKPVQAVVSEAEPPAWVAPVTTEPAPAYSTTSFIDKYRHLLEEDSEAAASPALKGSRPRIDEEFLSPAKAETCAKPADESDEALEAYMANMMRRVRSNSPSYESSQGSVAHEPSLPVSSSALSNTQSGSAHEPKKAVDAVIEEPFSFEDLKLATRKQPLASDLAALREIANSTARTAIATHSQRQSRESALTKIVVALTAMLSAAYLMASAPEVSNWQFWVGVATCVVGITASVQVILLERRRTTSAPPQFKRT